MHAYYVERRYKYVAKSRTEVLPHQGLIFCVKMTALKI